MKSHSPQVGPDSARLRSIWHQHWKGEGLSFPSMRLFSFFPHCAETWQPTSQGRVPLLHPLAHWQHPVFVLHKGWLRVVLLMKSKQGQRWCSGLQTFKWLRCGYSWLCVWVRVCGVCVSMSILVWENPTLHAEFCSLYSVQNKWHTPLEKLQTLVSQCPFVETKTCD